MSWKSLSNDLSDPSYSDAIFPKVPSSVIKQLAKQGINNFFPFKIVPLSWLIEIGKANIASNKAYQRTNKGVFYFCQMFFTQDDPYLPLGDIIFNAESVGINPVVVPSNIWVLLVKNDFKYSTIIQNNSWIYVSRSRSCNGAGCYWSTRAVANANRDYGEYKVLGDTVVLGDSDWWWWNPGTQTKWPNENIRVFAAVHPKYLSISKTIGRDDSQVINMELLGDYSCRYNHRFSLTSPFYTFNVAADEDTGGGERDWNTAWPKYMFFDIVPQELAPMCCSNVLPDGVNPDKCGTYWGQNGLGDCQFAMKKYCVTNNLQKVPCKEYCKLNDCDMSIASYCNPSTYEEQLWMYENFGDICSCFMSSSFYARRDEEYYSQMGDAGKQLVQLLKASNAYGGRPECTDLKCKSGGLTIQPFTTKSLTCPNIQIQNCINQQAQKNAGTINATKLDQSQVNQCVQSSQQSIQQAQVQIPQQNQAQVQIPQQTHPGQIVLDQTKLIMIGGGFIILLLILLIIVLMKK